MTIDALIMFVGAFVAILPFLGFPIKWDSILMVIAGIVIITLGIILRRRGTMRAAARRANSFVESSPTPTNTHEAV